MSTGYGYKVVMPDPAGLAAAGFAKVAHIPSIFDSEPGYARLPSQFLIDRALGAWDPVGRGSKPNPQLPSRVSIKDYAYWLCNALEWAEARGLDLMKADYSTVLIGRYQEEMLRGIWSARGEPLSEETVNARVQTALDYQMWAADKGLREPFLVPTQTRTYRDDSYTNSKSHEPKTVQARKGKAKVNKRTLSFPTNEQIKDWRINIASTPLVGPTQGLMIDHVLATAIRREELACWRVDALPMNEKDWTYANPKQPEELRQVVVSIKHGTKGRQFYIDEFDDKVGPEGELHMPLWLAKRIHEYRNGDRLKALKQATKGVRDQGKVREILRQSVHLYLNPLTGKRYTGAQIYDFWKMGGGPKHWSPHQGRDWWACQYLLQRMQEHVALIKQIQQLSSPSADHPIVRALRNTAQTVIQMEIKPQLRHVRAQTTETYVQWLFDQLRVPLNLTRLWQQDLDESSAG